VALTFFPALKKHLICFGGLVGQSNSLPGEGLLLNLVLPPEKCGVVEMNLVGELLRADPLRDPAKHRHDFPTVVVRS
jgi:hypothetical protein